MDSNNKVQDSEKEPIFRKPRQFFRAALLMVGSALLGGLAVAVFNRKQIESIRQNGGNCSGEPRLPKPEEEI
jgi:hypothetical protein